MQKTKTQYPKKMLRNVFALRNMLVFLLVLLGMSGCGGDWKLSTKGPQVDNKVPTLEVKAYIENSGSMNGYMCSGAELKDAVYSYLSQLNGLVKNVQLNYVNADITPMGVPLSGMVDKLELPAFSQAGVGHSSSDFKQILSSVISNVNEGTVAVFVSDCILALPKGKAKGFLNITQTDIQNIVTQKRKQMPSLSFCIYQLESRYEGKYYFPGGMGTVQCSTKRPYYMWVIGAQKNLAYILRHVSYEEIPHGVRNYCAFAPSIPLPNALHSSQGLGAEASLKGKTKNGLSAQVAVDLSQTLQEEKYLSNVGNYAASRNNCKLLSVSKRKDNTEGYSHILSLEVPESSFSEILTLRTVKMPEWVKQSNGQKDDVLEEGKTFSIQYIIGGVAAAYEKEPHAGSVTLTHRKK